MIHIIPEMLHDLALTNKQPIMKTIVQNSNTFSGIQICYQTEQLCTKTEHLSKEY
ncbi:MULTISPECIES: hypothetical protein [unclassified Arcicella]|uniref:hypothetical protein n=1 Tax=unclassified Arcicella TaxID=2644986 RepID=UPI002859BDAD|nr:MULTISPECIES: hypothetical protein [unclassified Arcicella]MDR6563183.1 hypothetical protein [Arcicella sp. BE51]MDR6811666.1 hypothetical protein [Arcicella sp. BE140]MDR6823191.1 hypothetical protein [Arcicella sp. BE139]